MKIKAFVLVLIVLFLSQPMKLGDGDKPQKQEVIIAESKDGTFVSDNIQAKKLDPRAKILTDYLDQYNSPLASHSQDFIDAADEYGVDWKLVPSIAGVESTFGKQIPGGYNAWGWGVYGDQALGFKSWRDGIYTVTGGLKENYINKGLTEPYAMNRVYAASPTWGAHVTFFVNDLTKYAQNYPATQAIDTSTQLAGTSAQLQ